MANCLKFIQEESELADEINIDAKKTISNSRRCFDSIHELSWKTSIVKTMLVPTKQDTHVDERSIVRGVAIMPGRDVHRQERTTNRINHTHSLTRISPSPPNGGPSLVLSSPKKRKLLTLFPRKIGKLSTSGRENEPCPLEQHASRNRARNGMETRGKWGKNVPPETKLPGLDVGDG